VAVAAASLTENQAGTALLTRAKAAYPSITRAWADQGLANQAVEHGAARPAESAGHRSGKPGTSGCATKAGPCPGMMTEATSSIR